MKLYSKIGEVNVTAGIAANLDRARSNIGGTHNFAAIGGAGYLANSKRHIGCAYQ